MIKRIAVLVLLANLTSFATSAGGAEITERDLGIYRAKAENALLKLYSTAKRDPKNRNVSTSVARNNQDFKQALTWMNQLERAGPISFRRKDKTLQVSAIMSSIARHKFEESSCVQVEVLRTLRSYHEVVTAFVTQDFAKIDKVISILDKMAAGSQSKNDLKRMSENDRGIWKADKSQWDELISRWEMIARAKESDCKT